MCYGEHEQRRNVPCHVKGISCGKACKKLLACGQHTCPSKCHPGSCADSYTHLPATPRTHAAPSGWDGPGAADDEDQVAASGDASAQISDIGVPRLSCGLKVRLSTAVSIRLLVQCERSRACGHPCQATCHEGAPCPSLICTQPAKIYCACGARSSDVECHTGTAVLRAHVLLICHQCLWRRDRAPCPPLV